MFSGTTPTTEVEAVNLMLSVIGEQPVRSIEANQFNADVTTAHMLLRTSSRSMQIKGWTFNTEEKVVMVRDGNGQIILPPDIVRCKPSLQDPAMRDIKWVIRHGRLFNVSKDDGTSNIGSNTDLWDKDVTADIVRLLPFEHLPEPVRFAVTVGATIRWQNRFTGSETLWRFSDSDLQDAITTLAEFELDTGKFNLLNNNQQIVDNWNGQL